MRQMRRFSSPAVALAIAATAMVAAAAPSSAHARAARHHAASHLAAQRAHGESDRPYRAYGAMPGGPGFADPSYPGFGYGYGDNSHGCSACGP
jgi:hypothetical protein